ncbi:MAG: molecular chaperone HtpG [Clostridia bacterium]|nr:molecular chaperone HtpG [Clostridia bacterium]
MAKKQFKTESKRLLDLMINSVYTNKEIFLRELISNASDALDKLHFKLLTDNTATSGGDLEIRIVPDRENRTLTIIDNGIGMSKEELEVNLGTIAKSGTLAFRSAMQKKNEGEEASEDEHAPAANELEVIGQFGVGFYSAFMVADRITVLSRAYGSDEANIWESDGLDGYTVSTAEKPDGCGTVITLHLKENGEDERFDRYLETYTLKELIKKYSDYIRYPIKMTVEETRMKEHECEHDHEDGECDCEHKEPEYETVTEEQTLNSMVPLWRRNKSELTDEDYNGFYTDKFHDYEEPLAHIHSRTEGGVTYNSILFIPASAPYNYFSKNYKRGLQLYSNGVMIMESCEDLLPEYFGFVKGLVDSSDISLNISREMLQQSRQLRAIASGLKKKIRSELEKLLENDREKYEKFFKAFGLSIKYGIYESYGMEGENLKDLLLYKSAKEDKLVTLKEYIARLVENQTEIYYACGESEEMIKALPQYKYLIGKGYDVLLMTENVDEFMLRMLNGYDGKPFKSITDNDVNIQDEDEKKALEEKQKEHAELLEAIKTALDGKVKEVRLSARLSDSPAALTSEGPLTLEMEKVLSEMPMGGEAKAERVLELNPDHPVFEALSRIKDDEAMLASYAGILYGQAQLLAGLKLDDPAKFAESLNALLVK